MKSGLHFNTVFLSLIRKRGKNYLSSPCQEPILLPWRQYCPTEKKCPREICLDLTWEEMGTTEDF